MMVIPDATLPIAPGGPFPRQVLAVPTAPGRANLRRRGPEGHACYTSLDLLGNLRAQLSSDGLASAPFSRLQ